MSLELSFTELLVCQGRKQIANMYARSEQYEYETKYQTHITVEWCFATVLSYFEFVDIPTCLCFDS